MIGQSNEALAAFLAGLAGRGTGSEDTTLTGLDSSLTIADPYPRRPYRPTCARTLPGSKCGRRGDGAASAHGVRLELRRPALKWDAGTGRLAAHGCLGAVRDPGRV